MPPKYDPVKLLFADLGGRITGCSTPTLLNAKSRRPTVSIVGANARRTSFGYRHITRNGQHGTIAALDYRGALPAPLPMTSATTNISTRTTVRLLDGLHGRTEIRNMLYSGYRPTPNQLLRDPHPINRYGQPPACSDNTVISGRAPIRTGGPQKPAPRVTYSCVSSTADKPASAGCTASTTYWNGHI